jgi:hypothetical protein
MLSTAAPHPSQQANDICFLVAVELFLLEPAEWASGRRPEPEELGGIDRVEAHRAEKLATRRPVARSTIALNVGAIAT